MNISQCYRFLHSKCIHYQS